MLLLKGLDHFAHELLAELNAQGAVEARGFFIGADGQGLAAALAWADAPAQDAVWFEFCWPPFTRMIGRVDLGGRRTIVRVHRIEAYGSGHAASVPWSAVDDVVVVGDHMAEKLRPLLPPGGARPRLHVVHNGVDTSRFVPCHTRDPFRIGWCGWFSLHKNPLLAVQVLHALRAGGNPWTLSVSTRGIEPVVADSFVHLAGRLGVAHAIHMEEGIPHAQMPAWHAANAVLLSTSVYESFGFAIAEAAAAGCDLAVLDYVGAADFWPEATLFGTAAEAAAIIEQARPGRWRGLIEERFSLSLQALRVSDLLQSRPARAVA
jgi:glycosyltransferase involved in cell wall biosynthesis